MTPGEVIENISDRIRGNPPYKKKSTALNIARTITGISTGEKIGDTVLERTKKGNIPKN